MKFTQALCTEYQGSQLDTLMLVSMAHFYGLRIKATRQKHLEKSHPDFRQPNFRHPVKSQPDKKPPGQKSIWKKSHHVKTQLGKMSAVKKLPDYIPLGNMLSRKKVNRRKSNPIIMTKCHFDEKQSCKRNYIMCSELNVVQKLHFNFFLISAHRKNRQDYTSLQIHCLKCKKDGFILLCGKVCLNAFMFASSKSVVNVALPTAGHVIFI